MTHTDATPCTPTDRLKKRAAEEVRSARTGLIALSHAIHDDPEPAWAEHNAARRVADILEDAGFQVTRQPYGIATAVEANYGGGPLTVAICAEYDALPGVGHGCGHNVIAAAGVGAALALAAVADEAGLRVKLLGTPAEEDGGGKVALLEAGAFDDVDFSLMVHGMTGWDTSAADAHSLALDRIEVEFTGRASHAAGMPELGINAGSAAVLAQTAVALLRHQLSRRTSVNTFISFGGEATNIIPDRTVVKAEIRADDLETWRDTRRRVLACFEGAAIATGCTWSWKQTAHPYAPLRPDPELARLWDNNLLTLGRTIGPTSLETGSTDMGNVSQVLPAIHPDLVFLGETATAHNREFAAAAITPAADDTVCDGAVLLAWTALDAALDESVATYLQNRRAARSPGETRATLKE